MSSFHERQKNLFNHLKDAEDHYSFCKSNKATEAQDYNTIDKRTYRKIKYEMKQFRHKESIFKRPEANIRECLRAKTVPGYLKNPQKWVHYTLADVTPDQMSDSTNIATALAFIREMEEKDAAKTKVDNDNETDVVFKKPIFHISATVKKNEKQQDKITFKSSKIVMPEYVVGVSQKKEKKNKMSKKESHANSSDVKKVELRLNHLYEDE